MQNYFRGEGDEEVEGEEVVRGSSRKTAEVIGIQ
jgi:hypothetical protein